MVVGKTSSSISITELFSKFSETQVLQAVFPQITEIPCLICSPFRSDISPSLSIYMTDGGHIAWKDFGNSDRGSLMDLLCLYWNCTFNQALDKIVQLPLLKGNIALKSRQIKTLTRKEASANSKIEVKVRPWRDYDYEYWKSYGVKRQWLHYAEVYPISYKIVTKKDKETGVSRQYAFPADKLAYCFVERKEGKLSLKIYQPHNTKGFKWCSKMNFSVISLWTKIPEYGDRVIICSSLKDALCISCNLHIPAIALQGEGYNMSETACKELKRRYKQVFIAFDTDTPGLQDAQRLSEKTGFPFIVPDLGTEKDYSDFYKSLKNKEDFKQLEKYFI